MPLSPLQVQNQQLEMDRQARETAERLWQEDISTIISHIDKHMPMTLTSDHEVDRAVINIHTNPRGDGSSQHHTHDYVKVISYNRSTFDYFKTSFTCSQLYYGGWIQLLSTIARSYEAVGWAVEVAPYKEAGYEHSFCITLESTILDKLSRA